jgi:hypothetical protein
MTGRPARRALALAVLGLVALACSPTASLSPSPSSAPSAAATPNPTPAITPVPSATPAASASVAAAADPSIGLKIAAPYELKALDPAVEAVFRQQFMASAGAFGSLIGVGGRNVTENGTPVGFVFVVGFPAGIMNDIAYQSMVSGLESSTGVAFKTTTISGTAVSTGASATGGVGVYKDGDNVVILITPSAANVEAVAKALIAAN